MSLAGRFFPSTMRMVSELRLAIIAGSATPGPGCRQGAGAGARRARGARVGRGSRFHFIHPRPGPLCGDSAPAAQSATGTPGSGRGGPGPRRSLAAWGDGAGLVLPLRTQKLQASRAPGPSKHSLGAGAPTARF